MARGSLQRGDKRSRAARSVSVHAVGEEGGGGEAVNENSEPVILAL